MEWYNTQFYCGWGDARSTGWYDAVVAAGWDPRRVVLGVVTNAANGAGHVGLRLLREVCGALRARYAARGGFGGVMGWEYFNAGARSVIASTQASANSSQPSYHHII